MNVLQELNKAIDRLYDLYIVNQEVMEKDDAKDLLDTIDNMRELRITVYKKQLERFVDYLHKDFPEAGYDKEFTKWTNTPYVISHGDQTVIVDNYADVYDGLCTLLKDHLKDIEQ